MHVSREKNFKICAKEIFSDLSSNWEAPKKILVTYLPIEKCQILNSHFQSTVKDYERFGESILEHNMVENFSKLSHNWEAPNLK